MKPRKSNVSGRPSPRSLRFALANLPKHGQQARLLRVHFQPERCELLPDRLHESLRIAAVLKPQDEIIGVPHEIRLAPTSRGRHSRANQRSSTWCRYTFASSGDITAPCGVPLTTSTSSPAIDDAGVQPLPDETQHPLVPDTHLQKLHQLLPVDAVEVLADVHLHYPVDLAPLHRVGQARPARRAPNAPGTFQDRLVTELRLASATTIAEAQSVLERFLPRFNARFAVAARQPAPAWRPLDSTLDLGAVLAFRHTRTVARDNTVKYHWRTLQLLPSAQRPSYAGARVDVLERPGGELAVRHRGETIPSRLAPVG